MKHRRRPPYLEIIRHVIIFAPRSSQDIMMTAGLGLVRRRCLGVVGLLERVTLRRWLVFRIVRHVYEMRLVVVVRVMMILGVLEKGERRKKVKSIE